MTRPGYRTSAQKEGRSAGQRRRRMARERKRRMREQNLYSISVRSAVASDAEEQSMSNTKYAVFGIYKEGDEWKLTAMAVQRNEERLVSDRQGATRSEVRDRAVVTPQGRDFDPRDGLVLDSFDKKSDAMDAINAESSSYVDTGAYVVLPSEWGRSMATFEVDRDKYRNFLHSNATRKVHI